MPSVRHLVGSALPAALLAFGSIALTATTASADSQTCRSHPSSGNCYNQDPGVCWSDANYVAKELVVGGIDDGTLFNWYSPSCQSNWAQFSPNGNVPMNDGTTMAVVTCLNHQSVTCSDSYKIYHTAATDAPYSNMVYAPTTIATAWITVSTGEGWGGQTSLDR